MKGERSGPGVVYFIRRHRGGLVKIGLTVNLPKRASELGVGRGSRLLMWIRTSNMLWLEQYFHVAFNNVRQARSEWFAVGSDKLAGLNEISSADRPDDLPEWLRLLYLEEVTRAPWVRVGIDDEVLPLAKAAAALTGVHVHDFISEAANQESARVLGRVPLTLRRSPHGKGRPRKTP